ncbi:MAG: transporter [Ramlibacter sp.]|nr:transporter [Ramlibacter sp.]
MNKTPSISRPLAGLALCMLLPSLGTSIANVALPTLAEAFGVSLRQVQWIVIAYLLANTALIVGVGRLGDLLGKRRLLLAGIALFVLASLLCALAPSLWLLVAARALQGVAAALMMALSMALVVSAAPKGKAGSAMALLGTMSAIGTALGPSLGGALLASLGWPAIFLVNLPLGALTLLLAWRSLPPDAPGQGAARARSLLGLDNVRDPVLRSGLAMSCLVSTVLMATLVVGPFYLTGALGLDIALAGMLMSVGPIVAAIAGTPAGRLVDRLGARRTTAAGLVAIAAGCLALALLPGAFGLAGYLGPIVVITAGYSLFQAANNTAVLADAPADRRGVISGLLNLSRNLGLIAGASAMAALFAAGGLRSTFAVALCLILVALALALAQRVPPAPATVA